MLDESLTLQLRQAGLVVRLLQGRCRLSDEELCRQAAIAPSTLRSIKAGRFLGSIQCFVRLAQVFDVAFVCRFGTMVEALDVPKSFEVAMKDG